MCSPYGAVLLSKFLRLVQQVQEDITEAVIGELAWSPKVKYSVYLFESVLMCFAFIVLFDMEYHISLSLSFKCLISGSYFLLTFLCLQSRRIFGIRFKITSSTMPDDRSTGYLPSACTNQPNCSTLPLLILANLPHVWIRKQLTLWLLPIPSSRHHSPAHALLFTQLQ